MNILFILMDPMKVFFCFLSEVCCARESPCCRPGVFVVEDIYNSDFAKIFTNANSLIPAEFFPIYPH